MNANKRNTDPCLLFDGFDCPQKLDSLEKALVDDSWFLRKSLPEGSNRSDEQKCSSHGEPQSSKEQLCVKLTPIKEKENCTAGTITLSCSSSASESPLLEPEPEPQMPLAALKMLANNATAEAAMGTGPGGKATENQCQLRSKWETLRQQRERRHEQLRQLRKDSMCRREQAQAQLLRAAAVPKAQPIRHYKPVQIHRSDKPLTVPRSPAFALSRKERHNHDPPE